MVPRTDVEGTESSLIVFLTAMDVVESSLMAFLEVTGQTNGSNFDALAKVVETISP